MRARARARIENTTGKFRWRKHIRRALSRSSRYIINIVIALVVRLVFTSSDMESVCARAVTRVRISQRDFITAVYFIAATL